MNKRNAIVWAGLIVLLPLLLLARQQQSVNAPIPQATNQTAISPVSQKQIKILESKIEQLKIEVRYLALKRGTVTSGSLDDKADKSDLDRLKSDLDDKADESDLRRLKSDLDDKADESDLDRLKSDLDDKADKSSVEDLESKVKGLYCHFNLKTGGIFAGWPSSCF